MTKDPVGCKFTPNTLSICNFSDVQGSLEDPLVHRILFFIYGERYDHQESTRLPNDVTPEF